MRSKTRWIIVLTAFALMAGVPRESVGEEKKEGEEGSVAENCCSPKQVEGGYDCVEIDGNRECVLTGHNWKINGECIFESCESEGCTTPLCDFSGNRHESQNCAYTGDVELPDGDVGSGEYTCEVGDMSGDEFVELCSRRGGEVLLDLLDKNPEFPRCSLKPGVYIECYDEDAGKAGLSDHRLISCQTWDHTQEGPNGYSLEPLKIIRPRHLGYNVDWCATWGRGCGEPAANQFCRSRFGATAYALDFRQLTDVGRTEPTIVLGDGKVCNEPFCDGFYWIECATSGATIPSEYVTIDVEDGNLRWPMRKASSATASGNEYAWVPDGAGTGGYIHLPFSVSQSGEYVVWGREASNSKRDDSFYVQMIGGTSSQATRQSLWDTRRGSGTDAWVWDRVSDRGVADPVKYDLQADTSYGLVIRQREAGTKIDRVIITNDLDFVPFDVSIEAESGELTAPMRVEPRLCLSIPCGDEEASGRRYIVAPNGAGSGGSAHYTFSVPGPGTFRVLGRVKAPSGRDDSFFVSMDDSPPVLWDTGRHGWQWGQVRDRYLDPRDVVYSLGLGEHSLTVLQREDGTMLDQLLITNDAGFRPPAPINTCTNCTIQQ